MRARRAKSRRLDWYERELTAICIWRTVYSGDLWDDKAVTFNPECGVSGEAGVRGSVNCSRLQKPARLRAGSIVSGRGSAW